MPQIPCSTRTTCPPGFPGSLAISADNPVSNFSSLTRDQDRFISIVYPEDPVGPTTFYAYGCLGVCYGTTQAAADACAAAQQSACYQSYGNTQQTCTQVCADGSQKSYTVYANKFYADTQAQADSLAYQYACEWVAYSCGGGTGTIPPEIGEECVPVNPGDCGDTGTTIPPTTDPGIPPVVDPPVIPPVIPPVDPPIDPPIDPPDPPTDFANTEQECSVACYSNGSKTATVPAGWTRRPTQEEADIAASLYACQLATLAPCLSGFNVIKLCRDIVMTKQFISLVGPISGVMYVFQVIGALPPGLSYGSWDADTIYFAGTPTTSGTYPFDIIVTGSDGTVITGAYSLSVAGWNDAQFELNLATKCNSYSDTVLLDGGPYHAPLHFTLASAPETLPPGLVLDEATGLISGIPTATGVYEFVIQVEDSP